MSTPRLSALNQCPGNTPGPEKIGEGGAAIILAISDSRVIKVPIPSKFGLQAIEQEREVYRRLLKTRSKYSSYVLRCHDPNHSSGLVLEKCTMSVRDRLRQMRQGEGTHPKLGSKEALLLARRWAYQAAEGLAFIHSHGVVQADDSNDDLKIADFSGSSIANTQHHALVLYDIRSRLPNVGEPDKASDLFALGSAIYEMATGELPYHTLLPEKVQQRFSDAEFPPVFEYRSHAPGLPESMDGCWRVKMPDGFKSAKDVVERLKIYETARRLQHPRSTDGKRRSDKSHHTNQWGPEAIKSIRSPSKSEKHELRKRSVDKSRVNRNPKAYKPSRRHNIKRFLGFCFV